ncbi:hypothetical protein [Sporosarcina sp. D27]|uniref:hypothetical protein n=1 Tax=Sporosarcina sp. D27 TaxID=1382305 RepID=UPI00046F507B|nr:hypothetical protein [Sporosarcina sp. D27]
MDKLLYLSFLIAMIAGIIFVVFKYKKRHFYLTLCLLIGSVIAFLAILAHQTMSFWYALIVILGLSFATAVLLAKQQEAK